MVKTQLFSSLGFTIIELLVVISLLAGATAGGLAAYSNFARRSQLTTAVQELASELQNARSRAQSQVKLTNVSCLDAYYVQVCKDTTGLCSGMQANSYFFAAACDPFNANGRLNIQVVETKILPPGVTVTTDDSAYIFNTTTGTMSLYGASSPVITLTKSGYAQTITPSFSGTVSISPLTVPN